MYANARKATAVLRWLETQPRDEGDIVASHRDISAGTGISQSTVRRALRRLLDHGQLVLVELGTGFPYSSRYRLASDPVAPSVSATPASPVA